MAAAQRRKQAQQLSGAFRPAGSLELEPRHAVRELQLPQALAVLDPVAQRDAVAASR